MRIKIFIFIAVIVLLGGFKTASASILINEVRTYPSDGRFIELYNDGPTEVDLSGWYIQRKTETGSSFGSLVSSTNFENKKITPNSFFVIGRTAGDEVDLVLSTLTLTDGNAIQIKNQNGDIVDKVCWGSSLECVNPVSNPSDSQSINRTSSMSYVLASPSMGLPNSISNNTENVSTTSGSTEVNFSGPSTANTSRPEILMPKTKIIVKSPALVGVPVEFDVLTTGITNQSLFYGKYFWNFGDGSSKEVSSYNTSPFHHTFYYEGEYSVVLEYYENNYSSKSKAVDTLLLDVVPKSILISKVGDEADFFVEILNDTEYDTDISGWSILSENRSFVFPTNTTLRSKKKIILSPQITGFIYSDKNTLKLLDKLGTIVHGFGTTKNSPIVKKTTSITNQNNSTTPNIDFDITDIGNTPITLGEDLNLSASASSSVLENKSNFSFIYLVLFLSLSGGAVYFIRKKGRGESKNEAGGDFEILDE